MRILWVKVGGLWPLTSGGRLRSYHLVSELSRRHRVTVLTTHAPGEDADGLRGALPGCESVLSVPHRPAKRGSAMFPLAVARSWCSAMPVDIWKTRVPALAAEVHRRLASGDVDLCVADFLFAVPNVPLGGPVPAVLFEHNVEHMIWQRLCRSERRPWARALLEIEWRKMRRYEARACARARATIAVSGADRAVLSALAPGARIAEIPTGVDTAYFAPDGHREAPGRLVFTGSMDWYPNEDAILYFTDRILPAIRREMPEVSMAVVGRNPTPRLRAVAEAAGIRVTGTVDDVRPYVADAAVYVVPLRVGGGTRLKIFEALAMAKAVVSTSVGAEGLPLTSGEHFLRADEPAEFAASVVRLLRAPELRRRIGRAGRALIEGRYAWPQVAAEFESRCQEAMERHEFRRASAERSPAVS
jgi:sugar transferase (PEP-CTERM/EpsH1 system associated)